MIITTILQSLKIQSHQTQMSLLAYMWYSTLLLLFSLLFFLQQITLVSAKYYLSEFTPVLSILLLLTPYIFFLTRIPFPPNLWGTAHPFPGGASLQNYVQAMILLLINKRTIQYQFYI